MKLERKEFYQMCIDKWGKEYQVVMCMEEMSELTKALCKYYRYLNNDTLENKMDNLVLDIKEEIADALNLLEQMQYMFGIEEIEAIRDQKIKRTIEKRINNS